MSGKAKRIAGALVLAAALVFLAVACSSGPTYDTDEFHSAIKKANENVDKYNATQKEIDDLWGKVNGVPASTEGFGQAVGYLKTIETKIGEQKDELEAAVKEFEDAKKLNLQEDHKTYLQLLIDSTEKRLESNDIAIQMAQETAKVAQSAADGTGTEESITANQATINTLTTQAEALEKESDDLKAKADKLYTEKKLGVTTS